MLPIATDGAAWSAVLSVSHSRNVVRDFDLGGPKESCVRGSQDPPKRKGNFNGGVAANCKVGL